MKRADTLPKGLGHHVTVCMSLNNRAVAKDTEQDLVLAPKFHRRLFLQPKLNELLCRKSHKNIISDDASVTVSVNQHNQSGGLIDYKETAS